MPSSLIGVLRRHCEDIDSACLDPEPPQFTSRAEALGRIPDPRRVRGRRYRLGSLLALCLVAVLGGATSLAAIARFAADTDYDCANNSVWPPVHRTPPHWDGSSPV
ncbi:transposase family protein [Streptomyces sp. NPDC000618]|uniref:transposase family protein n=1 Tax=Streptomyces sp. NPDC000618 TaxID=3154265 RepID=UPI003330261F